VSERDDSSGSVTEIARREFLRRWAIRLGITAIAAGVAFASYRGYGELRQRNLARQVQQFVDRGEYTSAALVARRLLELDPDNVAATRAMADMADASGSIEAVSWRQRIVQLQPGIAANQLALAKSALRAGQPELVDRVLDLLSEEGRKSVDYHQVAGLRALARKQTAAAESHFAAAAELEPANEQLALNLASIRLTAPDREVSDRARQALQELAGQSSVRVAALRALAADALARNDRAEAQNWTTQLKSQPGATYADTLLFFHAVQGTEAAAPALEELKTKAAESPGTAAEFITWMNRQRMAVVAAHWSAGLPEAIRNTHPVPLAEAEALSFMQDWDALHAAVEGKNWGEHEALRLAVESHALQRLAPGERGSMQRQTVWRAALKAAERRPDQLVAIAQLAEGWGYTADAEEAWWKVANSNANPSAGLSALQRLYKAKQDTRGLLRVAKRALELNPRDLVAANNCASLGLLLTGDSTARRLAAKLHGEHPANRAFAATHAFALHTAGKTAEALQVMDRLKEEELRHPALATYYVVMLVESGNLERARTFLPHAQRAALLPEEQQLLSTATRKLVAADSAESARNVARF
jgi:predicted Zn-dependent protease